MPGKFTFYSTHWDTNSAFFDESEYRHAILACRYQVGYTIEFTNGEGIIATGKISQISKKEFTAEIIQQEHINRQIEKSLYVGILKHPDRLEWMVEKCAELGVKKLVLMKCDRTEKNKIHQDRLEKIAISALKQSHDAWLMKIAYTSFDEALEQVDFAGIAYCDSAENKIPLHQWDAIHPIFIGPEGDFSKNEINKALEKGFASLDLGKKILRTETAAMVAASISLL